MRIIIEPHQYETGAADGKYRPVKPGHQIRKIVRAMQTRPAGLWTDPAIQQEYKRQNPADPFQEGRPGGFRNQLQRFCATAARHTEGSNGLPYAPLFDNPSAGQWRLAEGYERYLPD